MLKKQEAAKSQEQRAVALKSAYNADRRVLQEQIEDLRKELEEAKAETRAQK